MNRRGFLTGLSALIAAPAIVRAGSLMPVRGIVMDSGLNVLQCGHNSSIWLVQWGDIVSFRTWIEPGTVYGFSPAYSLPDLRA